MISGSLVHPEHLRDREPVDVGVEDADVVSHPREGHGQVDRDRRLADTALARGDPEDPGLRSRQHEPVGPALLVAERAAVAVAVARGRRACVRRRPARRGAASGDGRGGSSSMTDRLDGDLVDPGQRPDRPPDPARQLVDLGVVGHRQGELDADLLALDLDPADHAQLAERSAQLGIDHRGDGGCDLGLVDGHGGSPREIRRHR